MMEEGEGGGWGREMGNGRKKTLVLLIGLLADLSSCRDGFNFVTVLTEVTVGPVELEVTVMTPVRELGK